MTFLLGIALGLMVGAFLGLLVCALLVSGHREDECRECLTGRLRAAFDEADSYGGSSDE